MNKCQVAVENDFDCLRGLNISACINLTRQSLQCKFLNYCYGPNNKVLECDPNSTDCCLIASSKEVCLFQIKFKCLWNIYCQAYQQDNSVQCNQIKEASVSVCSSIQDQFCIFDPENFVCKQIIPQSCDEVQTPDLCKRIIDFPCVWNEIYETCNFKEKNILDECQSIENDNGNLKACIIANTQITSNHLFV